MEETHLSRQNETVPVHQEDQETQISADAPISSEYLTVPEYGDYIDVVLTSNSSHPSIDVIPFLSIFNR